MFVLKLSCFATRSGISPLQPCGTPRRTRGIRLDVAGRISVPSQRPGLPSKSIRSLQALLLDAAIVTTRPALRVAGSLHCDVNTRRPTVWQDPDLKGRAAELGATHLGEGTALIIPEVNSVTLVP